MENQNIIQFSVRENVGWLVFDAPNKKVNTLNSALFSEFTSILDELKKSSLRGVILTSAKADCFIAGADIEEIKDFTNENAVLEMLEKVHPLLKAFEALPYPKIAAIHGSCLGGGLELALTCDYRVATTHRKTKLGLPEVNLGVIPGAGGTQRLPRLIGLESALDLILTGKELSAKKALKIGLVDKICEPSDLEKVALSLISHKPDQHSSTMKEIQTKLLRDTPLRALAIKQAKKKVLEKTRGFYPAPEMALTAIQYGLEHGLDQGIKKESELFAKLVVNEVSKRLMEIFFWRNEILKESITKEKIDVLPVSKIGVLGGGLMGAGIAQVLAYQGVQVWIKEINHQGAAFGLKYCYDLFNDMVKKKKLSTAECDIFMSKITATLDYEALKQTPMVIEAVFEDLALKQKVLADIEAVASKDFIFASNTSSLPISQIGANAKRPENVIGMHFFSPVHKMPLVEIIKTPKTSERTLATTVELAKRMGKLPIVVNDGPGFFTTRVLGPYMNEAAFCLVEGAKIQDIDNALLEWGFPVGPMVLIDEVGIDVAEKVTKVMVHAFGGRMVPPDALKRILDDNRKGRKNKRGFYTYEGKKKSPDDTVYSLLTGWKHNEKLTKKEIAERCVLQMLNEITYCMQENIITSARDIDMGVIFGFGFPPFRGGILKWADSVGISRIVDLLKNYEQKVGGRFTPSEYIVQMAKQNQSFHS